MIDHSPSRSGIFLLLAAALTSPCLAAAPPFLVEDINPATQEQRLPALHELRMVSLGGFVYFQGYDGQNGLELWRTDGTPLGTSLVRDICPGACSANPASLAVAGSRVFFTAEDGVHGRELWTSDGTAAGTSLVRDLRPGLIGSELGNLTGLGSKLLLVRLLPFPGLSREIWVSDGTTAGTFPLLTGIEASFAEATTFFLGEVGGRQLFVARDAAHGNELWATDGTVAGTALVKDIHPGTLSGITQVESAKGADGRIYFVAEDGAHGAELWASDGTAAGTVLFADLQPGSNADGPRLLTRFGSWIAFRLASPDYQVWRTDGTPGGTFPLTAQNEGIPMRLGWAGSHLFFFNEGGNQAGFWASDGTPEGTQRLLFEPSGAAGPWLFPVAGRMLFYWGAAGSGLEPWVSDGTAAGTQLLADIESGPSGSVYSHSGLGGPGDPRDLPALLGSRVFFGAFAGVEGNQLWASDGTPGGTALVADLDLETSSLLRVADLDVGERFDGQLTPLGAGILFKATDGVHGVEPWASQGTPGSTALVADLTSGSAGSNLGELTPLGGQVVFRFADGVTGLELWASDGTAAGTQLVDELVPGPGGTEPEQLTSLGSRLFFRAAPSASTLASSDGSSVAAAESGLVGLDQLTGGEGELFYSDLEIATAASRIWRRGPTGPATLMTPGDSDLVSPVALTPAGGGRLFFFGFDAMAGGEPWWAEGDGSAAYRLRDVHPGSGNSLAEDQRLPEAERVGNRVYFVADDGSHGFELWVTDGSTAGTVLVADLNPGTAGSEPRELTAAGSRLFFVADDGAHGRELWMVPALGAAPSLVVDLVPGAASSVPQGLTADGSRLYWSAWTAATGREGFVTDGSPGSPRIFGDLAPGALSSSPVGFRRSGAYLYFAANDHQHGFELWALPVEPLFADGFESGSLGAWALVVP